MFCTKCGKEIDDNATFCKFCGTALNGAAPAAPQQAPVQNSMPQYGAPQNGAPQSTAGGFSLNLAPNVIDLINKILRGSIALVALLTLIGAIGTLGTTGSILSNPFSAITGAVTLYNFMMLLRVASIIAFSLSVAGCVFTVMTKQRSLFSYISAAIGVLIFIFQFILFGAPGVGVVIVFSILLILLAAALVGASMVIILKKEDIIKFKPKF